ncbi:MAG: Appr-1-p processing protein [Bdellovibrionaceae bacterium]|nr:Appr-1-p processing protein [Pseudobdellovibrionaceae bacterium]
MIKYVSGDILLTKAEAVAHGVAPNDNFKQGLAFSLREQWPAMYKDFRHFCKETHPKEGGVWSWKGPGGPIVYNLLTQEHPPSNDSHPGKAKLSYLRSSLKELRTQAETDNVKSLALPKVATGVGGLAWEDVKPVIEEAFSEVGFPVFVYETFQKNTEAKEV